MNSSLSVAVDHQRAGRYADAARLYHDLLTREPDHPDALNLFGVMHHQCGHPDHAAEMIGRAISLRPGAAAFHSNISEALRTLGQHEAASEAAREALRIQANYPEAANNLGLALQALGRQMEAMDAFETALRLRPEFALARNNLGALLQDMGRGDEALQAFREAVELDPDLAPARANFGQCLVDAGEGEAALEHCLEAARLQPDLPAAQNSLGNAYRLLGRLRDAYLAYSEALRLSPGIAGARVHSNLGLTLQEEGLSQRAFACLRRATELAPDDPEVWRHLAVAHGEEEDYASALPACRRVVELAPDLVQGHSNLGWALQQEGQLAEAAESYRRALEIRPDHEETILNRAVLHEELGEMAEAEACYRRALATSDSPIALARLATLLRGRLPEEDRAEIRSKILNTELADEPRSSLLFALAHVSDARGDHGEAADCMERANALMLARRNRRNRGYDPAEHVRFVDRMIAGFSPEFFGRLAGVGDPTRQPIFVMGLPRSGTTLVEQVLSSHPSIHGAGELRLARQSFEAIPEIVGRNDGMASCLEALDAEGVRVLAERHLAELRRIDDPEGAGNTPERIVDKMPDNYLHLGLLAVMFPRAVFLHVRRDPRDIALSCWMTSFRSIRWANDIDHIAGRIEQHHRLMDHWRATLPVPLREVVYEDLVGVFEPEARRLVDWCELAWDPACLEFHRTERPVRTASVAQVRQPLYRGSLARWRRYEAELAELFDRLPVD